MSQYLDMLGPGVLRLGVLPLGVLPLGVSPLGVLPLCIGSGCVSLCGGYVDWLWVSKLFTGVPFQGSILPVRKSSFALNSYLG